MWVTFWFDGNSAWGKVDGPQEWKRIQDAYKDPYSSRADLKTARMDEWDGGDANKIASFGFRREHQGPTTLAKWAAANGMTEQLFGTETVQELGM